MKKYRDCVADAFVLRDVLEYVSERADSHFASAQDYKSRAEEEKAADGDGAYYIDQANEYEAKAAAFERLLTKLSK